MVSFEEISKRFYYRTIERVEREFAPPDDLCFVYVQHAFLPSLTHFQCIDKRLASVVLKNSSSRQNPSVVERIKRSFPGRVHSEINRAFLEDPNNSNKYLKDVTKGRPFVILEYGGYFAATAAHICDDSELGPQFKGVVEGTENGIKGSEDGTTTGYREVVDKLSSPVISKAKSKIKLIMDLEIGPAIVGASDGIISRELGYRIKHFRGNVGIIGMGTIGRGVLDELIKSGIRPMVNDSCLPIMAELAYRQHNVQSQTCILKESDILFLCSGSCFLSLQPELLTYVRDNCLLILCTSGDVEGGIPQLISAGEIEKIGVEEERDIAVYRTRRGSRLRIMLGNDGVGQAPNMSVADGSMSPANMMSDMEFYALGCYLGSDQSRSLSGGLYTSPTKVESIVLEEWLDVNYPGCAKSAEPWPLLESSIVTAESNNQGGLIQPNDCVSKISSEL